MIIRKLGPDDFEQVDRLMQQVHQIHLQARPDLFIPLTHPLPEKTYQEMISSDQAICLAAECCEDAEQKNQIIGICFVSMRNHCCMVDSLTAYMEDLCVDEHYRHLGVGHQLFEQAEKLAKEKGATRLDLMVWDFNHSTIDFYRAMGMTPQRYIFEKNL